MFCSKDRILRRARTFHRTVGSDDSVPPVPPMPADLPAAAPMAIPMPLPPTARPTVESQLFHSQQPQPQHHLHHAHHSHPFSHKISHFLPSHDFARHASSCSSHASSSWSSASSTTSASSIASSSPPAPRCFGGSTFNPLRMHPPAKLAAGLGFADDAFLPSSTIVAPTPSSHGFNFGFDAKCTSPSSSSASSRHADRLPTTSFFDDDSSDEEENLDDDDDEDDDDYVNSTDESAEFSTMLSPPPHYHRLRAPQSEATLLVSAADHASPLRLRPQSGATDTDHYIKRGDWKRRGIVFTAHEA